MRSRLSPALLLAALAATALLVVGPAAGGSANNGIAAFAAGTTVADPPPGAPYGRVFVFSVVKRANGVVTGFASTRNPQGVIGTIALDCFTVQGNQAIVGGLNSEGIRGAFAIQDGPDASSFFLNQGDQFVTCDNFLGWAEVGSIGEILSHYRVQPNPRDAITIRAG